MPSELTAAELMGWVAAYERSWRDPRTQPVRTLFSADATYVVEPYAEPIVGLPAIEAFWAEETAVGETFTMTSEVVACSGSTGVVRVAVRYGEPVRQEYLDLWVVTFDGSAKASRFEEWPFWPSHGRSPARPAPVVMHPSDVAAAPYGEWVRSGALSAGVYRLAAGSQDGQSPHAQDEVYVVTSGTAHLEVDGKRTAVRPGSVAYVPNRVPHRFVDITEDLEVAVVFAPPESG
jgi:mannose-6-phosphate isomerase-like protein (cupin superfamily)